MIRHSITYILLLSVIIACRNQKETRNRITVDDSATKVRVIQSNTQPKKSQNNPLQLFDWNSVLALKNSFMKNLLQNKYPQDSLIVTYLDDYNKIVENFNEILFRQRNYDSLNTLLYKDSSNVFQCALDFRKKVEKSGFKIAFSEGLLYITESTNLIKSDIINVIDPISKEFINLYCNKYTII